MNDSNWWNPNFRYRLPIILFDTIAVERIDEPVRLDLVFDVARPHPNGLRLIDSDGQAIPFQVVRQGVGADGKLEYASLYFLATLRPNDPNQRYYIYLNENDPRPASFAGIERLEPQLADGFRRLDTGHYILELCCGTAEGHGGSKWGIRHFEEKEQGLNLIVSNMNAFGGVYGPFFTLENGLVNPPAHMVIDITPVTEGPIVCTYHFSGSIPTGIRPELANKRLDIYWTFFFKSPWFVRTYFLDDYETVIDGRPCRNKMTVGDEIESGKNNLFLSTYTQAGGTRYRSGDRYHTLLLEWIQNLRKREPDAIDTAMEKLGIDPGEDTAAWHWDNYWRLFCVLEGALPREILERELAGICKKATEIVWSDKDHIQERYSADFIDVNSVPQQSIYPFNSQKTCMANPQTGYSFVRYVNRVIDRLDIIQRHDSGWVNWGTNGENEYPELPSGSTIWSAYGRFEDWEAEASRMETPLALSVGAIERTY